MSKKSYFRNIDDEFCYPLQKHLDDAKEEGLETIELYEAIPDDSIKGFFFCNHFVMVCEKEKDTCGRICEGYAPRNGKSGMCKHQKKTMECSDEKKSFKVSGKKI